MSPSEDELRAALRHGAGESLDVDGLMQHANAVRRGRRIRIASVAAAVIAVAGIGVGSAVVFTGDDHPNKEARPPLSRGTVSNGLVDPSYGSAIKPGPTSTGDTSNADAGAGCPSTEPANNGTPPIPSPDPLIATSVTTVVVCAYFENQEPVAVDGEPVSAVLAGADVTTLANSLNNAPTTAHPTTSACSLALPLSARTLVLLPTDSDGSAQPIVFSEIDKKIGCNPPTNSTVALRYSWVPPPLLDGYLAKIRQVFPGVNSGANSGSPAH